MRPSIVARVKLGIMIMMYFVKVMTTKTMMMMMMEMMDVVTLPEHKAEVGRPGEPKHSA